MNSILKENCTELVACLNISNINVDVVFQECSCSKWGDPQVLSQV